jgi:hypothetical protein
LLKENKAGVTAVGDGPEIVKGVAPTPDAYQVESRNDASKEGYEAIADSCRP